MVGLWQDRRLFKKKSLQILVRGIGRAAGGSQVAPEFAGLKGQNGTLHKEALADTGLETPGKVAGWSLITT